MRKRLKSVESVPELKTYNPSHPIYKHDAINIADPSGTQDLCQTRTS